MFELNEIEKRVLKEALNDWLEAMHDLRKASADGNADEEDRHYYRGIVDISEGYFFGTLHTIADLRGVNFYCQLPNALYGGMLSVMVVKNVGTDDEVLLGEFVI